VPLLASRIGRAQGDTARADLAFEEARRLNPAMGLSRAARVGAAPAVPTWSSPELEAAEDLMEKGEFALAGDKLYQAARDKDRKGAALYWLSRVTRISGGTGLPGDHRAGRVRGDERRSRSCCARWPRRSSASATRRARSATCRTCSRARPTTSPPPRSRPRSSSPSATSPGARNVFNSLPATRRAPIASRRSAAAVFAASKDAGAAIARQRAAAVDYLPGPERRPRVDPAMNALWKSLVGTMKGIVEDDCHGLATADRVSLDLRAVPRACS
jgi:hypothetical protein